MKRARFILWSLMIASAFIAPLSATEIWIVREGRESCPRSVICRCEARYGGQPTRVYVPGHWTWRETPMGRCYRKWEPGRWVVVERRAPVCRCQPAGRQVHHPTFADRCGYR